MCVCVCVCVRACVCVCVCAIKWIFRIKNSQFRTVYDIFYNCQWNLFKVDLKCFISLLFPYISKFLFLFFILRGSTFL